MIFGGMRKTKALQYVWSLILLMGNAKLPCVIFRGEQYAPR